MNKMALNGLMQLWQPSCDDHRPAVLHEAMGALTDADHLAGATHRVGELELEVLHVADGDLDFDHVLERGGMLVVATDGNHRRYNPFGFNAVEAIA